MDEIIKLLRIFNKQRDWDQFHSPKNLVMALSVEVAELAEIMMWKTQEETRKMKSELLKDEVADVLIYTLILADKTGINIREAIIDKIKSNGDKYPISNLEKPV